MRLFRTSLEIMRLFRTSLEIMRLFRTSLEIMRLFRTSLEISRNCYYSLHKTVTQSYGNTSCCILYTRNRLLICNCFNNKDHHKTFERGDTSVLIFCSLKTMNRKINYIVNPVVSS